MADGSKWCGKWEKGKPIGVGTLTLKNETTKSTKWDGKDFK